MKIEVLYMPGCPNYLPAVAQVEKALKSESLSADIRPVAVRSNAEAVELMFPGSPTIRVNGEDIEPYQTLAPGLKCRLYANLSGIPSEQIIRLAFSRARQKERNCDPA